MHDQWYQQLNRRLRQATARQRRLLTGLGLVVALALGAVGVWSGYILSEALQQYWTTRALSEHWSQAFSHARATYARAHAALESLNRSPLPACSPAHGAMMRQIVMDNPAVEEVGYFQDQRLACTSWGPVEEEIAASYPDYRTPYGDLGTASLLPKLTNSGKLTALASGNYNILINPVRLLRSNAQADTTLVTPAGTVIASNSPQAALMARANAGSGVMSGRAYQMGTIGTARLIVSVPVSVSGGWSQLGWHWLVGLGVASVALWSWLALVGLHLAPRRMLRRALKHKVLYVLYQPIVDMSTNRCVGAEALLRWPLNDGSHVPPDEFIELAQDQGLLPQLTHYVIERALTQMGPTLRQHRDAHVTINLGAQDLESHEVVTLLEALVLREGIMQNQVWLEVTERTVLDIDRAAPTIEALHQLGYIIALDDFGTGYSGLHNLQLLPVSVVKLDKVFVSQMRSPDGIALTDDIIQFVQTRGLTLVAEGVETTSQRAHLLQHRVIYGQGWLFGRPEAAEQIGLRIRSRGPAVLGPTPSLG